MTLLIEDSYPMIIIPELACMYGVNEAIILQQIQYWIEKNAKSKRNFHDDNYWVYNTYKEWGEQFPWISISTIKRKINRLESCEVLISDRFNKMKIDKTKWYRINYEKVQVDFQQYQKDTIDCVKVSRRRDQFDTMDETNLRQAIPKTTTETSPDIDNVDNGSANGASLTDTSFIYDKDILRFINWYKNYYQAIYNYSHPNLKKDQLSRIHDTLLDFCQQYDIDIDQLKEMTESFFDRVESDHNLNHFATKGILEVRFYDSGQY